MLSFVLACAGPAFLLALIFTALLRRWAPRWDLVDQPGPRKVHEAATPLGGGIAIWAAVVIPLAAGSVVTCGCVSSLSLDRFLSPEIVEDLNIEQFTNRLRLLWSILVAATLLAIVGLIDDCRNLAWWPRLAVQLLVAIGLVTAGVRVTLFLPWPWVGAALTVLWLLVLVNAFNFLDNMDGLSAGIALIAAILFASILLFGNPQPHWLVAGILLVLAGALAGFLYHNRPPAKIFMGDAGSYFVGLLLATLTVTGTFYESGTDLTTGSTGRHVILAPLFILAVPLYDFCSVMLIRIRRRQSPFQADKNHFSHRLVDLGMSQRDAVLTIYLATLMTGLGGLLLYRVDGWTGASLLLGLIFCVLALIAILETIGRRAARREPDGDE